MKLLDFCNLLHIWELKVQKKIQAVACIAAEFGGLVVKSAVT